jgi:enoyl-CoA hydratase/carnithine racemase
METITYSVEDRIALIGLNRAAKRNAISRAMNRELSEAFEAASSEASVGIIFSHGDDFCAGLDLVEAGKLIKAGEWVRAPLHVNRPAAYEALARGNIPFIAALQGAVIGGGFEMAAAAHIRVADPTTYFSLPEGQRGIFVGGGGSVRISRLIGYADMADMMLTGRILTADEAHRLRLIQYMVAKGGALSQAKLLAAKIRDNSSVSNFAIVNALSRLRELPYEDGLFFERVVVGLTTATREAEQRLTAFAEKKAAPLRKPKS